MTTLRAGRKAICIFMMTLIAVWQVEQPLRGATLFWDIDSGAAGAQDGAGNWTAGGTTFWNGTANVATTNDLTTDIAQFGSGGAGGTVNVSTQSINKLIFEATTTSGYTLTASTTGQTLSIGSGGIVLNAGAQATTLGSANLALTLGASQTWTNNSSSLFTLSGAVAFGTGIVLTLDGTGNTTLAGRLGGTSAGAGSLIKNGSGTARITVDPNINTAITVNAGVLELDHTGSTDAPVTVASGATLVSIAADKLGDFDTTINGTWDARGNDQIGRLLGSGVVTRTTAGSSTITLNSATNTGTTFSGIIQNGSGTLALSKTNTNTVTLTGANTYTGTTTISQGTLVVNGATGSIHNSATINIGNNSGTPDILTIGAVADAFTGDIAGRLADTAAITLSGSALFNYNGPASGFVTETVGALTASFGRNIITLAPGTGSEITLAASSITRTNNGILLLRGNNLGTSGTGNTRLTLTTAPTGVNFVGGGGLQGSTNRNIIPWALGDTSVSGSGSSFVTYDATNGLTLLTNAEYASSISGATATDNVSLGSSDIVSIAATINSLRVTTGGSSTINALVTISSAAVLFTGSATLGGSGTLEFGTNRAILTASNTAVINGTINNVINGTGGILVSSSGNAAAAITLGGANTYTGGTVIGGGILRIGHANALNSSATNTVNLSAPDSVLELRGNNVTVVDLVGVNGAIVRNELASTTGTLTINSLNSTTYTGSFANGAGTLNIIKEGAGTFTHDGPTSVAFTGTLTVNQGIFQLQNSSTTGIIGSTVISINNAGSRLQVQHTGNNGPVHISDSAVITLNNTAPGLGFFFNNTDGNASRTETVGAFTLGAGHNVIAVDQTTATASRFGIIAVSAASGSNLVRSNRSTLLVVGRDLGNATDTTTGRIIFTNAITNANAMVGGGGTSGTAISIFPYMIGEATTGVPSASNVGNSFVTNTGAASTGLRPLDLTTEYVLNNAAPATGANNLRYTASLGITAPAQINSLVLDSGTAITLTGSSAGMEITSGAVLVVGAALHHITGFTGITTGGGRDYTLFVPTAGGTLKISSELTSLTPLVKSGAGTLVLDNAGNDFTDLYFNQGIVEADAAAKLGTGAFHFFGGALKFGASMNFTSKSVTIGTGGATMDTNGHNITFAGSIGNNGAGALIKEGAGTLSLSGANTYTGATIVNAGRFEVNGSIGSGATTVNGGAATQGSIGGAGTLNGMVTLATNGATSFMQGSSLNPGTVGGAGTLTLSGGLTTQNFSVLNFDLGAVQTVGGGVNDLISTVIAPIFGGTTQISINTLGTLTGGFYTLIDGYTGTIGTFGNLSLITPFSGTDNTRSGFLVNDAGALKLFVTASTPTTAYWSGSLDNVWNTFPTGSPATNWRTDASSNIDTYALPGSTSDVHFHTTTPAAGNLATTLGQNFTIKSLTFDAAATNAMSISGFELTVAPSSANTGITVENGAGAVTINSDVELGAAQTWTNHSITNGLIVNGAVSGGFNLTKAGAGTVTLNGTNSFAGTVTLSGGKLVAGAAQALGLAANALVLNGGILDLASDASTTAHNTTVGGNVSIISNRATAGAGITHTLGTLSIGAQTLSILTGPNVTSGTAGVTFGAADIGSGGVVFDVASGSLLTFTGIVSGGPGNSSQASPAANTAITIKGGGSVTFTNTGNSFTGDIVVDGGGFNVDSTRDWGSATVANSTSKTVTLINGGRLNVTSGTINPGAATNTTSYVLVQIGNGGGTIDIASGAGLTLDDAGQLFGSGTLTKTGAGTLSLRNHGSFSGAMIIAAGTLQPTGGTGFNFGTIGAGTTIQSGAALNLNGISISEVEPLTIAGAGVAASPAGVITNNSATAATFLGAVTLGGHATIGSAAAGGITLSGGISGAYNLTISNSAGGGTTLSTTTVNNGGSITNVGSGSGTTTISAAIGSSVTGIIQNSSTSQLNLSGSNTGFTSGIFVRAGTLTNGVSGGNGNSNAFGTGTITLGDTTAVNNAAVKLTGFASSPTIANAIVLADRTLATGTIAIGTENGTSSYTYSGGITGNNDVVLAAGGTGAGLIFSTNSINNSGTITNAGTGSSPVTISAGIGSSVTGIIQNSATSTLTLSNANIAFTGGVQVLAGTLSITGGTATAPTLNALVVSGGATLSLVNAAGQRFNLGAGDLTLGTASTTTVLALELGANSGSLYDSFITTAAATTAGTIQLNVSSISGFGAGTYRLLQAASGLDNALYTFAGSLSAGFTYTTSVTSTSVDLIASAITGVFWQNSQGDGKWNTLTAQLGGLSNWSTDLGGTVNAGGIPGAATVVTFSSQAGTVGSPTIATTLETPFTIDSLVFNNQTSSGAITAITIAPGAAGTLTLAPGSSANGINVQTGAPAAITISAPVVLGAVQTWTVADALSTLTVSGTLNMGGNALTLAGPGTKTISGLISGAVAPGTIGLTITGGTVNLTNNSNSFTGDIDLRGGTLVYSGSASTTTLNQLGRGPTTDYKQVFMSNGAVFQVASDWNVNVNTATNRAAGVVFNIGTGGGTFDIAAGRTFTVDDGTVAGSGFTASQLQGTGTIIKKGEGIWVLRNQNVFAGEIDVQAGTLQVSGPTAFGVNSAGTTIRSGAALNLSGQTMTDTEPLTIHGTGLASSPIGVIYNSSGTAATFAGAITLGSDSSVGGANGITLSGNITGGFAFTKVGTGTLILSGNNSYTGQTTISAGTLQLGIGGTTGSTGTMLGIINNGTLTLNRSDTLTQSTDFGNISGTGAVIQLGAGTTVLDGTNTYTGASSIRAGTLSVTGSTLGASMTVGTNNAGSRGMLLISGNGSLSVSGSVVAGSNATAAGAIYQTGGTMAAAAADGNNAGFALGTTAGGYGYYKMSGGTLTVNRFSVGGNSAAGATGVFELTGGTVNNLAWGLVVHNGAGNSGLMDISGGTYYAAGSQGFAANHGSGGYAVINVRGTGTLDRSWSTGSISLMQGNASSTSNTGILNLATGGTVRTGSGGIVSGAGTGSNGNLVLANFNGGTIITNAASNNLINILSTGANTATSGAYLYSGGLTVDTNGFNSTINGVLRATGEEGVSAIAVATQGSGYIGAPMIKITGGSGVGATAVANMVDDGLGQGTFKIGSITITNPGTGYLNTDVLTLSFGDNTAVYTTQATFGSVTFNGGNTSGGLIKTGAGTLTLTAANTYTGGTTVNNGTLALGTGGSLADTGVVTVAGGTFDVGAINDTVSTVSLQSGSITGSTGVLTSTANYDLRSGSVNFTGTGGLAGSFNVNKSTGGTVTLSGNGFNTSFANLVNITGGALIFSTSAQLGNAAAATNAITLNGADATLSYSGAGSVDLGSNRVLTVGSSGGTLDASNSAGVLIFSGGVSNTSTGNLIKTGPGAIVISGSTDLNGGTVTVSGGTLRAGFGTDGVSAITVAATGNLSFENGFAQVLNLTGALNLADGSRLGFELGAPSTSDHINSAIAAVVSGTIILDFINLGGLAAGTYDLISAPGGLDGAGYVLGTAPAGFNYTINASDTLVSLVVSLFQPRYWTNSQGTGSWSTLTGGTLSNFSTDLAGSSNAGAPLPGAANTIVFSATPGGPAGPTITTTLDGDFTIDSLQFTSAPTGVTAVTIARGSSGTLTLAPSSTVGGIEVQNNAGTITISAPVVVGAAGGAPSQTWSVSGAGASLVVSGGTTFTDRVNKTGAGALTLSGTNSGAGGVTLTSGTLNINSTTALGTGAFIIGAGTTINNSSAGTITLGANNIQTWNGSFTFVGTQNLNLGTGAVTLINNATVTTTANTLTVGGAIGDGDASRSLTKDGAGTLVVTGGVTLGGSLAVTTGTGTFNGATNTIVGSVTASGSAFTMNGASTIGDGVRVTAGTATMNGNNTITGTVVVTGGTLNLGGANTISGGTSLTTGTLNLANAGALGTSIFTINSGTINNTSGAALELTTDNALAWNGNFTFTGTHSLNLGDGAVTLGASTTITTTANTLAVNGVIGDGASILGIVKAGAGTLSLGGANTYEGTTTLGGGTLIFTADQNLSAATNTLIFGSSAGSGTVSSLNLDNASATFEGAMTVQTNSASNNTISIGAGETLRVNRAVTVGYNGGAVTTTRLIVTGGGTFTIGDAATPTNANVQIGNNTTDNFSNKATLDMSGLATFYANLGSGTFRVGDPTNGTGVTGTNGGGSTLILADTSTIRATTITSDSTAHTVTQAIKLGSVANYLHADTITIGGATNRATGTLDFNEATGTVQIRNLAGTGRANMNVQNGSSTTTSSLSGTVDFNGHSADLLINTLAVGGRSGAGSGGVGDGAGTFSYNQGTLDATTLNIAARSGTTLQAGSVTGTVNLGGGVSTIGTVIMSTNSVALTAGSSTGDATSILNISGGTHSINTLTMGVNTVAAGFADGSNSDATIHITGGATTVNTTFTMGTQNSAANAATSINNAISSLNISAGSLTLAGSTNLTMAQATLDDDNVATATISITGTGVLTVGGNIQYTNATLGVESNTVTLDGGTLDMTGGNIGGAGGTAAGAGIITFNAQSGTLANVAQINGGAGLTKTAGAGANVLILEGTNAYTGNTVISSGTLQLGSGGATGSMATSSAISVASGATFAVKQSDTVIQGTDFSGAAITGDGGFEQSGSGTTVFTTANTYAGGTVVSSGTLQLGSGGTAGSLNTGSAISVGSGAVFAVNQSDTVVQGTDFSGSAITGAGGFAQTGSGVTILNTANSYGGGTTVSAGTLEVNNTTGSGTGSGSVNVNGGKLAGSGSIAGTTIIGSGAVLAPGVGDTSGSNATLTFTAAATSLAVNNGGQIQLGVTTADLIDGGFATWFQQTGGTAQQYVDNVVGGINNTTWNSTPAGNHDFITAGGALVLGDSAGTDKRIAVSLNSATGLTYGSIFNLLDWGTLGTKDSTSLSVMSGAGAFDVLANLQLEALSGGFGWDTSLFNSYGILVVVPEPSRALLLLLGLLGLMLRRRRKW